MDLSDWLNLHADAVLLGIGLLVTLVAAVCAAVYGCELMLRGAHRVGRWRLEQLHQAQQALGIRLEMSARARQQRDHGEQQEGARLRREAEAAARQLRELRQLLAAQEEVLHARAARIAGLEGEQALAQAALAADQAQAAESRARAAASAAERDQLADELTQRDQVIALLERQHATQQHAAELAQAGLGDARAEMGMLAQRLQAAEARCALLGELQEARATPAGRRGPAICR